MGVDTPMHTMKKISRLKSDIPLQKWGTLHGEKNDFVLIRQCEKD